MPDIQFQLKERDAETSAVPERVLFRHKLSYHTHRVKGHLIQSVAGENVQREHLHPIRGFVKTKAPYINLTGDT